MRQTYKTSMKYGFAARATAFSSTKLSDPHKVSRTDAVENTRIRLQVKKIIKKLTCNGYLIAR